jgi:hypothetical protein
MHGRTDTQTYRHADTQTHRHADTQTRTHQLSIRKTWLACAKFNPTPPALSEMSSTCVMHNNCVCVCVCVCVFIFDSVELWGLQWSMRM